MKRVELRRFLPFCLVKLLFVIVFNAGFLKILFKTAASSSSDFRQRSGKWRFQVGRTFLFFAFELFTSIVSFQLRQLVTDALCSSGCAFSDSVSLYSNLIWFLFCNCFFCWLRLLISGFCDSLLDCFCCFEELSCFYGQFEWISKQLWIFSLGSRPRFTGIR